MEDEWCLSQVGRKLMHSPGEHVEVALDVALDGTLLIVSELIVDTLVVFLLGVLKIYVVFVGIERRLELWDVNFILPAMLDQDGLKQVMVQQR